MYLNELILSNEVKIFRNGLFDIWGMLTTNFENKKVLSFIESEKYLNELDNKLISCVFCTEELKEKLPPHVEGILICDNPRVAFFKLHNVFAEEDREKIDTKIGIGCTISDHAYISPYNVIIGKNVIIEEFVSIKEYVEIGDNCIIRAGTIVGGEGYEFKKIAGERQLGVRHMGRVVIGDDVEIQQLTNVARAVFPWDKTIIGDGTKVDSLVHIAHSVKIGEDCNIVACGLLGGSAELENGVWIGPNATVTNSIHLGYNARISLGSVVTQSVDSESVVSGNFAINHIKFIENLKKSL